MIPSDLYRAVEFMEARWGYNKKWSKDAITSFFDDFEPYTPGALMETLHLWFKTGNKFGPSPSELLKAVAETQIRRLDRGVDSLEVRPCGGSHVWALPFWWETDRHPVCVRCGEPGPVVAVVAAGKET